MAIVGALDIHRRQITFDWVDHGSGESGRGKISPADRVGLRKWLEQFAGDPVGLTGQPLNRSTHFNPMFVWRGHMDPHLAAFRFRTALTGAGARNAAVRCRAQTAQGFTLCRVDAVLAGVPVTANVGPALRPTGGLDEASTQIGLDLGLDWPLSRAWMEVPAQ